MLLGQAESGKSTLRKQFQLFYEKTSLDTERPSWRPVVYSNIVKAVRTIIEELDYSLLSPTAYNHFSPGSATASSSPTSSVDLSFNTRASTSSSAGVDPNPVYAWQTELSALRQKLLPLVAMEDSLALELSGGIAVGGGKTGVYVRSGWQALVTPSPSLSHLSWLSDIRKAPGRVTVIADLAARSLAALQDGIATIWKHPAVKRLIKSRQLRLDETAAYFLDNIHRIAEQDYLPTNEDILNVRIQTLGVQEHEFDISMGGIRYSWNLYDVGGARGQRHAWVPYFDDATAIIFLAPISAYDQYLEEDSRVNRIDDSLQLWTAICSNKLLKQAALVLLLNKTDLLRQKLDAGIKVRKYITSYGDRENTFEEASEYFRAHFIQVHRRKDISRRQLYVHFTSMLNVKATQTIIVNVNESIIRKHLAETGLS
ncbi:G-alpha-domain-containing protein [Punctularia strigosozonata HHB-11173 SS5]|uniref:G-alpha-domain-containing protein n=1 Tax=Punctularia strigosozonata (strain HHB-11173) TaxID=741275 RepID=UPI0004417F53|nr:G-alpha-domain-containing protein [Punctularia strigosozonata HHB-11173 SS5]EIN11213.1 G-alpha-domain-containing protein [Punctularia strigosozonata HHB-11173 SS5]